MPSRNAIIGSLLVLGGVVVVLILLWRSVAGDQPATTEPEAGGDQSQQADIVEGPGITVPKGFQATVFADNVGKARHIVVRDNGDVIVSLREALEGDHGLVAIRDRDGDGIADIIQSFGAGAGTGLGIHNGDLYFANTTTVFRYEFEDGTLVPPGEGEIMISGFPEQRAHASKTFTFDDEGNIYVNVGAPSNACQESPRSAGSSGIDPCPQKEWQASIWRFDASTPGQTQADHGYQYASGLRNAMAIDWNQDSNKLYFMMHGRDQLAGLWGDYYDDAQSAELPSEEFHVAEDGSNHGWPYTYYDHIRGARMVGPEYGGDGQTEAEAGKYAEPIYTFPGHWAPNDLIFYRGAAFPVAYDGGAFIAFHGSWNRAPLPQGGYKVMFVPFEDGRPSGDAIPFADGFKGADELLDPREAVFRPVGLAEGPDGAIYIADSMKGRIWRITYTGDQG